MMVKELREILDGLDDESVIEAAVTTEGQYGFPVIWDETFDFGLPKESGWEDSSHWPDLPVVLYIETNPEEEDR